MVMATYGRGQVFGYLPYYKSARPRRFVHRCLALREPELTTRDRENLNCEWLGLDHLVWRLGESALRGGRGGK